MNEEKKNIHYIIDVTTLNKGRRSSYSANRFYILVVLSYPFEAGKKTSISTNGLPESYTEIVVG